MEVKALFNQTSKSIKLFWILSYVFILMIPLLVTVTNYIFLQNTLKSEIIQNDEFYLNKLQVEFDKIFVASKEINYQIWRTAEVQRLSLLTHKKNNYDYYAESLVSDYINLKIQSNNFIENIYVYFPQNASIVSKNGCGSALSFYDYNESLYSYSEWKEILDESYAGGFFVNNMFSKDKSSLMYANSYPLSTDATPNVKIFVEIKNGAFENTLTGVSLKPESHFAILNENSEIIYSNKSNSNIENIDFSEIPEGMRTMKIDGENNIVNVLNSKNIDWKYIITTPENVYLDKIIATQIFMSISVFIGIVLGAFTIKVVFTKNYRPLKKTVSTMEQLLKTTFNKSNNEFSFIENSLVEVLNQKNSNLEMIKLQNEKLANTVLARIISDKIDDKKVIMQYINSYQVNILSNFFAVGIIYIEEELNHENINSSSIVQELKDKFIEFDSVNIFILEVDYMMIFILNYADHNQTKRSIENNSFSQCVKSLYAKIGIDTKIYISDVYEGINLLSVAHDEAMELLYYDAIHGVGDTLRSKDIKDVSTKRFSYPIDQEKAIILEAKNGNYSQIENIIKGVFTQNQAEVFASSDKVKWFTHIMIGTIYKAINAIESIPDDEAIAIANKAKNIRKFKTLIGNYDGYLEIYKELCNYANCQSNEKNYSSLILTCIDFIDKNYSNKQLNGYMVANNIDRNSVYISQLFKEQTGNTILHHIQIIRINKADELILMTEMSLEKISDEVGFTNVRTFYRVYKQLKGMSPGTIRNI